jgi:hypothetical protein
MGSKSSRQEEVRVDANVTLKKVRKGRYLLERTITHKCIFLVAASILPPIIVMFESGSFYVYLDFFTRSRSVEKRLICPHVSTRRPLDGFSQNLILETYTKICREPPYLVKIS